MITGELKNKVDKLWEMFWTGGLTNPLDVIEQITYLMFIRDLDQTDNTRQKESLMLGIPYQSIFADKEHLKWSSLRDKPAENMYQTIMTEVFPFIKDLNGSSGSYAKYMADAIFKVPTPQLLEKIITSLDDMYAYIDKLPDKQDARGDLYEYMLSKLSTAGTNGQFRTPRHIIRMMVELLDLQPGDTICDPACGTSGFLVSAGEYLKEKYLEEIFYNKEAKAHYDNNMFTGYDMDRTMLRIGAMNMMTHGIQNPHIEYKDSLSDQNIDTGKYTKILANPPFKGSLDYDIVSTDLLKVTKTKKTELLFLTLFLRMLKNGGRCASIVPDGVLFGSSRAHKAIRKEIIENHRLEAIISMPSGVFKPYAGVSTAVIVFTKTGAGGTDKVWFYDMENDGYSLDDKRNQIEGSNIPDIIERFKALDKEEDRKRTDQSFLVPKDEIVENDYDLSINKYKESTYVEEEYPHPLEILAEINDLEKEIREGLKELEGMLRG
ncbi:class I SAM-dependent DNA methyltransferase [Gudongella oleilytica]|jgi:type I restriction enzyme M protein|uniref:class I SAM-dependent DNA methyltransferase n=1 Tax=Gudongella oleilytica TaxID=1582259 RepID=UPI002A36E518|nr:class I SAM-dependent DNA methyltransferase [Gudongella oleilytica]MDY0256611.1 class I SAM-dependent DNA methyltransferase [Gudongella oleilytica]